MPYLRTLVIHDQHMTFLLWTNLLYINLKLFYWLWLTNKTHIELCFYAWMKYPMFWVCRIAAPLLIIVTSQTKHHCNASLWMLIKATYQLSISSKYYTIWHSYKVDDMIQLNFRLTFTNSFAVKSKQPRPSNIGCLSSIPVIVWPVFTPDVQEMELPVELD